MIQEILDTVFDDADLAHREHLLAESLSVHEALGEFYAGVRVAVDAFVESAIGLDVPPPEHPTDDIIARLEASYVTLIEGRDAACQDDPTLLNLHDEVTRNYTAVLYKLKRFTKP